MVTLQHNYNARISPPTSSRIRRFTSTRKKKKNSEKHSRKTWASILAQESGDGGDLTRENRQLAAHEDVDNF